jgi:hypothetical protein
LLADRAAIALALEGSEIADELLESILKSAQQWIGRLRSSDAASALSELTERVELSRKGLQLSLKLPVPSAGAGAMVRHRIIFLWRSSSRWRCSDAASR